jgi:hypothetical protein
MAKNLTAVELFIRMTKCEHLAVHWQNVFHKTHFHEVRLERTVDETPP